MHFFNADKLMGKITKNWIAKAVSVGLAIILFVFYRITSLDTRIISVPLTVQSNNSLVPASQYARVIRVSLRGDGNSIKSILEDDIEAYIDLQKYDSEGFYHAPVQIRKGGSALGIKPLEIIVDPAEISLQLDRKISKYIPLQANLRGNVASGYEFLSHTLTPAQIIADGPLSALTGVALLSTGLIDLDGRREDFSVTVSILNQNPLIVIRGNRMTEFRGFIRETASVRTLDAIPIICKYLNEQFSVSTEQTGSIRLEGSRQGLDKFALKPDFMYLDCSEIDSAGEYTLPVITELPDGLVILRQDPMELTVTVINR